MVDRPTRSAAASIRGRCPWLLIAALLATLGCGLETPETPERRPLRLFAAASLADVIEELTELWATDRGSVVPPPLEAHFAGSNLLAQQLSLGASADLFLSAGPGPMERSVAAGVVLEGSVRAVAGNQLVVVAAPGTAALRGPAGLLAFDRLALADPAAVPAGVYARSWLEAEGLWDRLEPRVVPALDVRAALASVTGGHLPAAVVYATDAATTEGARVIHRVPPELTPPIVYLLGTVHDAASRPGIDALRAFLLGEEALAVFLRHGFLPPPEPAP